MKIEEVAALSPTFRDSAGKFTDVFLVLSNEKIDSDGAKAASFGSCIHLLYKGKKITVTCDHVAKQNSDYITSPKQVPGTCLPVQPDGFSRDLVRIDSSSSLDLAIFQYTDDPDQNVPLERYNLERSQVINKQTIPVGLLSYIHGAWGEYSPMHQYTDGLLYHEIQIYSAFGPITSIRDDLLVGDFAEKEFVDGPSDEVKKRVPNFKLTGGHRDIQGCSGSGLWALNGEDVFLLGILLGRIDSAHNEHLIRFTPVWKVIDFVDSIFSKLK